MCKRYKHTPFSSSFRVWGGKAHKKQRNTWGVPVWRLPIWWCHLHAVPRRQFRGSKTTSFKTLPRRESLDRPCRYQSHGIGKGYTGGFHEYFGPDADIDSRGPELVPTATMGMVGSGLGKGLGHGLVYTATVDRSHLFDAGERLDSPRGALCSHSWRGQASGSSMLFWGFSPWPTHSNKDMEHPSFSLERIRFFLGQSL
jgi:hypothetical protein